jgi:hypothetical protein
MEQQTLYAPNVDILWEVYDEEGALHRLFAAGFQLVSMNHFMFTTAEGRVVEILRNPRRCTPKWDNGNA